MITITPALTSLSTPTPGATPAGQADPSDAAALDFGFLLGLGVESIEEPALPTDVLEAGTAKAPDASDEAVFDPATILDAIAAGQPQPDPGQVAGSPALPVPGPALAAQAGIAGVETPLAGASAKATAASRSPNALSLDPGKDSAPVARQQGVADRPEFGAIVARHAAAPEKSAAGELRAEISTRPIPESQALTHHLHAHGLQHAVRGVNPAQAQLQLPQQMATPAWGEGLADHAVWMARNEVQTAELHLNPAELGPIEVTLTLTGDDKSQATVQFSAAQASTREAIEAALPRLREMMQESGISLGQAGVDAHTRHASRDNGQPAPDGGGHRESRDPGQARSGTTALPTASRRAGGNGLVDTFA